MASISKIYFFKKTLQIRRKRGYPKEEKKKKKKKKARAMGMKRWERWKQLLSI